jgi:hypothetical protein
MPRAGDGDRDRQRDVAVPGREQPIERGRGPGGARGVEKGAALRRCLEMALFRGRESGRKLGDGAERSVVTSVDRAMRVREKDGVAISAALANHDGKPASQRCCIGDVAGFDRPLDAARIGERTDGIGRRQPRHQPPEGGGIEPFGSPVVTSHDRGARGRVHTHHAQDRTARRSA